MASGGTQNLGGSDYYQPFLSAGGAEIRSLDDLRKGDIIQIGQGTHTTIIVGRVSGSVFDVVDSNSRYDEVVRRYNRTISLDGVSRGFRMGTVNTTPPPNPDRDGDGVSNDSDRCPDAAGPGWNGGCPVGRPSQLLRNGSFETGWDNWRAVNEAGSVQFAPYENRERSHDGAWFMEMNSSGVNGSVGQDVSQAVAPGDSYAFSAWLRAAPGTDSFSGYLKLHGLGVSANEGSGTVFTVDETWTLVTAPLDARSAHDTLRAEIYMNSPGNLNVDGAQVVKNVLHNGSFESGFDYWRSINEASSVSWAGYTERARSHNGEGFAEMNSSASMGSTGQDVSVAVAAGDSYSFSAWLRAAPGTGSYSGVLKLHGLGVSANEGAGTVFTVSETWTLVTAPMDARSAHDTLRAEIYMDSPGNLDVDGAQLVRNVLRNASFETGWDNWRAVNEAASVQFAPYENRDRSHDGISFMEMNSSSVNGSVGQDVSVPVAPGDSYAFSAWVRAAPGTGSFSGHLTLYGLGVSANEGGDTFFVVGEQWTLVTAPLDARSAHDTLRAEIYMNSPGNLNVDGASLMAGGARTDVPRLGTVDAQVTTGVLGEAYTALVGASGGIAPYHWSLQSGDLPAGLTLAADGAIYGTPSAVGDYTAMFAVSDMSVPKATATRAVTITVGDPLRVAVDTLSGGVLSVPYATALTALGATGATSWSLAAGSLPSGLRLARTGVLSGRPTAAGTFRFVVRVIDSASLVQSATKSLVIKVAGVAVATTAVPTGVIGKPYSTAITTQGGVGSRTWTITSGALPGGVTLSSDGRLAGTPGTAGTFRFVVTVTDSASPVNTASRSLQLVVAPIAVRTASLKAGTVGRAYSQTLAAWGGAAPLRWSVSAGTLPPGLTLTSAGVVSGTPTSAGSYVVTIRVADASRKTATATFTVVMS